MHRLSSIPSPGWVSDAIAEDKREMELEAIKEQLIRRFTRVQMKDTFIEMVQNFFSVAGLQVRCSLDYKDIIDTVRKYPEKAMPSQTHSNS